MAGKDRRLVVTIVGDAKSLRRAIRAANSHLGRFEARVDRLGGIGHKLALTQGLTAAATAAASLGSALVPTVGVAGALPGVLAAGAQAAGAVTVAMVGVGDAIKAGFEPGKDAAEKFKEELETLPPSARTFVRTLVGLKPQLDAIRNATARGFFAGGATAGLRSAAKILPTVRGVLAATARELGAAAREGGRMIATGPWRRDLARIGRENAASIGMAARGALGFADALRHVTIAGLPLVRQLAAGAERLGLWVSDAALAGRESGRLAQFFQRGFTTASRLVGILVDVGTGIRGIFTAIDPSVSAGALATLERLARTFAALTTSGEGQAAIGQFFRDMAALAPELGALATEVGRILTVLAEHGGGLQGVLGVLTSIASTVATLLEHNPGLAAFVTQLLLWSAVAKTLGLTHAISSAISFGRTAMQVGKTVGQAGMAVGRFGATVGVAAGRAGAAFGRMAAQAAAATARTVAQIAIQGARWAWLGVQALINAARIAAAWLISMGPIAIVIAAVVGLVALIVANWDRIRRVITAGWNAVASATTSAWNAASNAVRSGVSRAVQFVRELPGRAKAALGNLSSLLLQPGRNLIQGLINGIMQMAGKVASTVSGIVQQVKDFLPFSPAKRGPFAGRGNPLYSGRSIGRLLASGLDDSRAEVNAAMRRFFASDDRFAPDLGAVAVGGPRRAAAAAGGGIRDINVHVTSHVDPHQVAREVAWVALTGGI